MYSLKKRAAGSVSTSTYLIATASLPMCNFSGTTSKLSFERLPSTVCQGKGAAVLSSHKRLIAPVGVALLLQVLVENGDSLRHAKELSLGQLSSIQSIESGRLNKSSEVVSPLDYDLAGLDIKMVKLSGIPNGKCELIKKGRT